MPDVDPTPELSQSEDVPLAEVRPIGPSEVASFLTIFGGFLVLTLGDDFGIRENAQEWGALMVGMATVGTSIARAIKHHGVVQANAQVLQARTTARTARMTSDALREVRTIRARPQPGQEPRREPELEEQPTTVLPVVPADPPTPRATRVRRRPATEEPRP